MTNTVETAQAPQEVRKADGTLITQTDNQTFIFEVFFNHNSKETFQDKLLRVVFAEETRGYVHANK